MLYNPLDAVNGQKNLVRNNIAAMYAKPDTDLGRVEKSEESDELLKSEGSRGGKVIGHTASGKAIYDKFNHASHSNFTAEDHEDARKSHMEETSTNRSSTERDEEAANHGRAIGKMNGEYRDSSKKYGASKDSAPDGSLGKTRSGKSIHSEHDHESHKDFSADDHIDAFHAHVAKYKDSVKARGEAKDESSKATHRDAHMKHETESDKHMESYRNKIFA